MHVRAVTPGDSSKLASLLAEMQAYYAAPCPPPDVIESGIAGRPAGTEFLVAEDADRALAGFAAFSALYPGPGLRSGLFLKELFVSERYRERGVGRALMRGVARIAVERGYGRVDWTADAARPRLLAFYDELGAEPKTDKVFFRLDGEALRALGTT